MTDALRYSFTEALPLAEGRWTDVLGGKGAALARMAAMDLPVPPGFTLTTEACHRVRVEGWFDELEAELRAGLAALQSESGRGLGDADNPLLVSVRSGAPVSMPGMMDTVLNAGMTEDVAGGLGRVTANPWFGWDTYRRFVESYAGVVLGAPAELTRGLQHAHLGHQEGRDLSAEDLAEAAVALRAALGEEGFPIPDDPLDQIRTSASAVFASWGSERAQVYRRVESISEDLGTAATVQMMTFGNRGERSGTGVAFTRDPSTGAPGLVGDFLVGAQGEDVVAGTHATRPVQDMAELWPDVADQLDAACARLEHDLRDLADLEFTVEDGRLWMLQVRKGKRSPRAALRIAIDMAEDPDFPLDREEALERVADVLESPPTRKASGAAPDGAEVVVIAEGLAASPGRAAGQLCTDIDEAVQLGADGTELILVRRETSPADIAGMAVAAGLVTSLGGLVSHAAVVARGWGVPAVVGASAISIEPDGIRVGDDFIEHGTMLTIDGDEGVLLLGRHLGEVEPVEEVAILRSWQRTAADHTDGPGPEVDGEPATEENCQRVLALKGMGSAESVATVLGCAEADAGEMLASLVAKGDAQELPGDRVRLLPPSIALVDERFAHDAIRLAPLIEPKMAEFHAVNDAFKEVVTSWQMREIAGETVPNDHGDQAYDDAVIDRLRTEIHAVITPIVEEFAGHEARIGRYTARFEAALASLAQGNLEMMAHPLKDSYHTVWFELHEELIRLTGRNRADEAAAGRG